MGETKDNKKPLIVKRIEITRGKTVRIDGVYEKFVLTNVADVVCDSEESLCKAEDLLKEHQDSQLEKWMKPSVSTSFDPTKLKWDRRTGEKGPYELCADTNSPEFKKAVSVLRTKDRTTTLNGQFYWLFKDEKAIGRKPTSQR